MAGPSAKEEPNRALAGQRTELFLKSIWGPLNAIGRAFMGDLWPTFYESIQDAIALGFLLQIPSFIGALIIGKEYDGFEACLQESIFGVNRYACFVIVISDFLLWIVLAGRIAGRFIANLQTLGRKRK
ncbi:MAG: hypothetical protein ABG776_01430 [Cyanobacteria bacterium J06555_13]